MPSSDRSPILDLPLIMPQQAQKHVTHNEALLLLDAILHCAVAERGRNAAPTDPVEGVSYVVGDAPTGDFAGHSGDIATRRDGAWHFQAPVSGMIVFVITEGVLLFDGSGFRPPLQRSEMVGIGTEAASGRRLSVASDSTLLTAETNDHRLTINKGGAGATASLVFQTAFSGRAEFGLAGGDDFSVKVSPDGAAWYNPIVVPASTGRVGINTFWPTAMLHINATMRLEPLAAGALPAAAETGAGTLAYVHDLAPQPGLVFSDGGTWRRLADGSAI